MDPGPVLVGEESAQATRITAALNFGDCLTYAICRLAGRPLLCTGDDFPQTDLAVLTQHC